MENLQKKCRTTGKKSLAYRGKSGQNTGNDFLALGLRVVLYLPNIAMKNGQICFSLPKCLAIWPAIQKIACDFGCDAVVHLGYGRDRLQTNFLEVLLPEKHRKPRPKCTSMRALNFFEVPVCCDPDGLLENRFRAFGPK